VGRVFEVEIEVPDAGYLDGWCWREIWIGLKEFGVVEENEIDEGGVELVAALEGEFVCHEFAATAGGWIGRWDFEFENELCG
jgi:hypothetical protein